MFKNMHFKFLQILYFHTEKVSSFSNEREIKVSSWKALAQKTKS